MSRNFFAFIQNADLAEIAATKAAIERELRAQTVRTARTDELREKLRALRATLRA